MNRLSGQGWGEENVGRKRRRERGEELSSDVAPTPNPFSRQPLPLQFLLGPSREEERGGRGDDCFNFASGYI